MSANSNHPQSHYLVLGTKAYGAHLAPMQLPGKESQPRHSGENFYWNQEGALSTLVSTIKIRQFGFAECINTEAMFAKYLRALQHERILPP